MGQRPSRGVTSAFQGERRGNSPLALACAPGRRRFGDAYIDLEAARFADRDIAEGIRILLGAPTPAPASGSADAVLIGEASYDRLGGSVSAAGDVNGDGFGDFILGAAANGEGGYNAGAAYVIFGKADGVGPLDLAGLDPADGFKILGDAAYDRAGLSVSAAGDVDGDGFDDMIVGAPGHDPGAANAGAAYLIFGKQAGIGDLDLASLAAGDGIRIAGIGPSDYAGYSVSSAGDVDGDGFDDLLIGAYGRNAYQGVVYLVFGGPAGIGADRPRRARSGGRDRDCRRRPGRADGGSRGRRRRPQRRRLRRLRDRRRRT